MKYRLHKNFNADGGRTVVFVSDEKGEVHLVAMTLAQRRFTDLEAEALADHYFAANRDDMMWDKEVEAVLGANFFAKVLTA
jgi:hypothetical protein